MVDTVFLKQLTYTLKHTSGRITVGSAMFATSDFKFGTKLQVILEAASNLVLLHKKLGRSITNTTI